jgi:SAM-dependent methyltransferase
MNKAEREAQLAAEFWSQADCSASDRNFYCFPPIRARACKLIFDLADGRRDWCEYWTVEKYLKDRIPFASALSLCCGFGEIERTLAGFGVFQRMTGIDIAPGAIEQAKRLAAAEGLSNVDYRTCDLNNEELPEAAYDLIWANGALHHIRDLESVIPKLHRALKPNGMLVSNEYVGPKYQQIGERQKEIVNAVVHLLPPELREDAPVEQRTEAQARRIFGVESRGIYGQAWRPTPRSYFEEVDPSECIASDRIIPILTHVFDRTEVKYFGGSILFYALGARFYDRFNLDDERHRKVLEMLFDIEDTLIATGEIPADNAHIICWKAQAS